MSIIAHFAGKVKWFLQKSIVGRGTGKDKLYISDIYSYAVMCAAAAFFYVIKNSFVT